MNRYLIVCTAIVTATYQFMYACRIAKETGGVVEINKSKRTIEFPEGKYYYMPHAACTMQNLRGMNFKTVKNIELITYADVKDYLKNYVGVDYGKN